MIFENGKYYRHTTGEEMAIVGEVNTTLLGECLVAETNKGANLKPVGKGESYAENWSEITKEEWMTNFSKD